MKHIVLSLAVFCGPVLGDSPSFRLMRGVVAPGGSTSSGGVFSVTGTAGETAAGSRVSSGALFDLASGFWAGRPAVVWPEAIALGVRSSFLPPHGISIHIPKVEWSPSRAGWRLQYSRDLITWENYLDIVTDSHRGEAEVVAVGPVAPHFYWRLVRLPQ